MMRHFMKGYDIKPDKLEKADVLQKLQKSTHKKTIDWMKRVIDDGLDEYVGFRQADGKLVWTGFGPFVGDDSMLPHRDIVHFWDVITKLYPGDNPGAEKLRRQTGGTFFMWRIALRKETWWAYNDENRGGKLDPVSGEVYKVYQYWINEQLKVRR